MQIHRETHLNLKYQCEGCEIVFKHHQNFKNHVKKCVGTVPIRTCALYVYLVVSISIIFLIILILFVVAQNLTNRKAQLLTTSFRCTLKIWKILFSANCCQKYWQDLRNQSRRIICKNFFIVLIRLFFV